jgi:small-conductance mechanosensitive channel
VVPNERLAQSSVENHTLASDRVRVEVSLWVAPDADVSRALALLGREEGVDVEVAEVDKDGVRLTARTWARTAGERGALEARLRASSLERLKELQKD